MILSSFGDGGYRHQRRWRRREIGSYRTGNANSWSAKTPSISRRWMTPTQALAYSETLPDVDLNATTAPFCLLPPT
ncbi:MAG: hypothetical protein M3387_06210 [Actinomycetota bacterium]|nr:hypothetical protein [Actinomycetota bacterium]